MNYYDILQVGRHAGRDEIRRAYRRLARLYHPDLNPGRADDAEVFLRINEAHEVLSDPELRRRYDLILSGDEGVQGGVVPPSGKGRGWRNSGFSRFFDRLARGGERDGEDRITGALMLTLEEALSGGERVVSRVCWSRWLGLIPFRRRQFFRLRIPAGSLPGQRLRIVPPGSKRALVFELRVASHPDFHLVGTHLVYYLDLSPLQAGHGGEYHLRLLGGKKVKVVIPAGVKDGQVLRLPGLGFPARLVGPGDIHLKISVSGGPR